MKRAPLGEVCVGLGLLTPADVDRILAHLAQRGRGRFGEIGMELGLLSEGDVASALARQFQLTLLPESRVARLSIPGEVLDLLPSWLVRERLLVPTFIDPDTRVLSLLTADPTDIPALRQASAHARASRTRLFVTTRSALVDLVDRVLPHIGGARDDRGRDVGADESRRRGPGTVVLEPDVNRLSALRRLEAVEDGQAEIVHDPEQVTATLEGGMADQVLYRRELADVVASYAGSWKRARPGVHLTSVRGYGPGTRAGVSHSEARTAYLGLIGFLADSASVTDDRPRARAARQLTEAVSETLGIGLPQRDAAVLCSVLLSLPPFQLRTGVTASDRAKAVLSTMRDTFDLGGLLAELDRRQRRPQEPGAHLPAEVTYTVMAALDAGLDDRADPAALLSSGEAAFRGDVLAALGKVWRRRSLLRSVTAGGRPHAVVMAVALDRGSLTLIEHHLEPLGFEVVAASTVDGAVALAAERPPVALIAGLDLDADAGNGVIARFRDDTLLRGTALFALTVDPNLLAQPESSDEEDDAIEVLEHPIDGVQLARQVRWCAGARGPGGPTIGGLLADLPLPALVEPLLAGRQTAEVQVTTTADAGALHVQRGELRAARFGAATGAPALREMLALEEGRVSVRFGEVSEETDLGQEGAAIFAAALAALGNQS